MSRIAIIAALPGELKPLVRGWRHELRQGVNLWQRSGPAGEWVAACAGIGPEAAGRAFAAAASDNDVSLVLSIGWAGALRPGLRAGHALAVGSVIDARSGERFRAVAAPEDCRLISVDRLAGAADKRRLGAEFDAVVVDMEAAAVARGADRRAIPFACLKAVSDEFGEPLPVPDRFIAPDGRFRSGAFAAYAAIRPWLWPRLLRLGRNSARAAQALKPAVLRLIESWPPGGAANAPA